jgi:hypothetical protein
LDSQGSTQRLKPRQKGITYAALEVLRHPKADFKVSFRAISEAGRFPNYFRKANL